MTTRCAHWRRTKRGRKIVRRHRLRTRRANYSGIPIKEATHLTFYHGTEPKKIRRILRNGLKPVGKYRAGIDENWRGAVFLSPFKGYAANYSKDPWDYPESAGQPISVVKVTVPMEVAKEFWVGGSEESPLLDPASYDPSKDAGYAEQVASFKPIPPEYLNIDTALPKHRVRYNRKAFGDDELAKDAFKELFP